MQRSRNFDPALFDVLIDQTESAASVGGGLSRVSHWIERNTRAPDNPNRDFSFYQHEFQRAILNDSHPYVAIRKGSQLGLTEVSLRLALAICAKFSGIAVLYVMPSNQAAQKLSMSRVDPIIDNSPRLKALSTRDVSSNALKKIGSSFLYFSGAAANTSAISIPARSLIIDEFAFADPTVVSVFTSRLGHQKETEKVVRYFSSPLHPSSDISALYEQGTMNQYMVYHRACATWVTVNALEDIKIPGFDDHLSQIVHGDLDNKRYRIDDAFLLCNHCHEPISQENMCDADCRAWVPTWPDRSMASYDAGPLVLPHLRTPQVLLKELRLYRSTTRWIQYSIGLPSESDSEMILQGPMDRAFVIPQVSQHVGGVHGAVIGMDVGKVSHIAAGKAIGNGSDRTFDVFYLGTVRQDSDNVTVATVADLYQKFGAVQAVVDAMPDFTLVRTLQGLLPYNAVYGCYFVRGRGKANLASWERVDADGAVKVARTRALDEFVSAFNRGKIRLPLGLRFEEDVKRHLQRMKRINNFDNVGEEQSSWVATDPETHFFFAIFYAWLAAEMSQSSTSILPGLHLGNLIAKVKMPGGVGNPLGSGSGMGVGGVRGLGAGFGR